MHADHTQGLTPAWRHKIYCSECTKKLVVQKFGIDHSLVVELELGTPHIIEDQGYRFSVTLNDANHCPGSVMFMFEGEFGRVFCTGDFRYHDSMKENLACLSGTIDCLYLDNTYCEPNCVFPSQKEATKQILAIIKQYPKHNIIIAIHSLGKEELLVNIAKEFHEWIVVTKEKYETLEILNLPNVFTTNTNDGRILVRSLRDISRKHLNTWNKMSPTIAIVPTCMFTKQDPPFSYMEEVFVVPYSLHSSFSELREFVGLLKPKSIVPIVTRHKGIKKGDVNPRMNMNIFQDLIQEETLPNGSSYTFKEVSESFNDKRGPFLKHSKGPMRKLKKRCSPCGVVFESPIKVSSKREDSSNIQMKNTENLESQPSKKAHLDNSHVDDPGEVTFSDVVDEVDHDDNVTCDKECNFNKSASTSMSKQIIDEDIAGSHIKNILKCSELNCVINSNLPGLNHEATQGLSIDIQQSSKIDTGNLTYINDKISANGSDVKIMKRFSDRCATVGIDYDNTDNNRLSSDRLSSTTCTTEHIIDENSAVHPIEDNLKCSKTIAVNNKDLLGLNKQCTKHRSPIDLQTFQTNVHNSPNVRSGTSSERPDEVVMSSEAINLQKLSSSNSSITSQLPEQRNNYNEIMEKRPRTVYGKSCAFARHVLKKLKEQNEKQSGQNN